MKPTAIIVDIDGTLAHRGNRSPYDETKVINDSVDGTIKKLVSLLSVDDNIIILLSGRHESCRPDTIQWLNNKCIDYDKLFMRKTDDNRNDAVVKEEIYKELIEPYYDIEFVLDDRNRVVDMWRGIGLKCLQVADGNF